MTELSGDENSIFDSPAEAIVCPVNCVGVMGKGLALDFAKRYPQIAREYQWLAQAGLIRVGRCYYFHRPRPEPGVVLFPTKVHWKDPSRRHWVAMGLGSLAELMVRVGIHSIAIPALGCGLGGLKWEDVRTMLQTFADIFEPARDIVVYTPRGAA